MRLRVLGLGLIVLVALVPAFVSAQTASSRDDSSDSALIRLRGNANVAPGERIGVVVAINGNVTIEGTVTDLLLVIDGDATVTGVVGGDLTVINGTLTLAAGSSVDDIYLIRSTIVRDPAATVSGEITERDSVSFDWRGAAIFSLFFWIGATVLAVVAALLFAAVAGRQLATAGGFLSGRPGESILAAVLTWIALPIFAVAIMFTLVGIPVGFMILVVLLPALFALGYIVTATRIGATLTASIGRPIDGQHPYLAAVAGVLILQIISLVPFVGGFVFLVAAIYGSGALVYLAWRAFRNQSPQDVNPPPQPATT